MVVSDEVRPEHLIILTLMMVWNFWPRFNQHFRAIFPFFLFALIYDALRFVTPVMHALIPIHVAEPYYIEQALFGYTGPNEETLIPTQYFADVSHPVIDFAAAFAYFFFVYEAIAYAFYLLVKNQKLLLHFGAAFLSVSLLGFATWYLYPAAPPWYVELYGLGPAIMDTPGNSARLIRVDEYLGLPVFAEMYSRASNVFGDMPSMHACYPLITFLYGRKMFKGPIFWAMVGFWALVGFSAVYLNHHYVIDVLLGCFYGVLVYFIFEKFFPYEEA